jgi:uncharacterized protein YdbL (DUF1318 family)
MLRIRTLPALILTWFVTACVTINIYFPAAAAEKAADRIIKDVYGEKQPAPAPKTPAPSSDSGRIRFTLLDGALDLFIPQAHAAANLDVSSPAIQQLTASMKARHGQLAPYYNSGAVGMTRDGLITVRDLNAVPLPERNRVKKLVADENNNRNALYREIARANGHPEWEPDIRATFAQRWIANAQGGWWYQDTAGNWKRK